MQTMRLSLGGSVVIALLTGASVAVAAQSEEASAPPDTSPVVVSGTLDCLDSSTSDTGDGEAVGQSVVTLHAWEADDTRLTGEVNYGGHWQLYAEPSEDAGTVGASEAAVYEIVNEGGSWLCEAARTAEPRTGGDGHTLVFSGEDGYEGLTAYLHVDWSTAPFNFSGVILSGETLPYAEPAE
jgi:hypothetical protein